MANLVKILPSVTQVLQEQDAGILEEVRSFKFLFFLFFFSDILDHMNKLSLIFQKQQVSIAQMWSSLQALLSLFKMAYCSEKFSPGENLSLFLRDETKMVGLITITRDSSIEDLQHEAAKFTEELIRNLSARFPKQQIESFLPLSFADMTKENIDEYGEKEISALASTYLVDSSGVLNEWRMIKHSVITQKSQEERKEGKGMWSGIDFDLFPKMGKLVEIFQCIPLSSVDCERGFSRQNLIKTQTRNSLETKSLENLMTVSLKGPELKDLDQLSFEDIFSNWMNQKNRKFER